jgi:hypothetical protein
MNKIKGWLIDDRIQPIAKEYDSRKVNNALSANERELFQWELTWPAQK